MKKPKWVRSAVRRQIISVVVLCKFEVGDSSGGEVREVE